MLTFLGSLSALDEATRRDLICARLLGKRTISGLQIKIDYQYKKGATGEPDRYVFVVPSQKVRSGYYRWYLKMPDEYVRLVEAHRQLDKLRRFANKDVTLTFEGVIVDVASSYLGNALYQVEVTIDSVIPLQFVTPQSTGDIKAQILAVQEKIKMAYEEYMTTGFN